MGWRVAVAGLEAARACCAALNVAYFLHRTTLEDPVASRRVAAFVLALISLGVLLEGVFVLGSVTVEGEADVFASRDWAILRSVAFAASACMTALVLRRMRGG